MSKIKDYIKEHGKCLKEFGRYSGLVLAVLAASLTAAKLKTNIRQQGETFIVSNYDLGKGYVFIYHAEKSGYEYLMENKGGCRIYTETDKEDNFKPKTHILFEGLGKNHPLNDICIHLEDYEKKWEEIGEKSLSGVREKYRDKIPFQKILDK